MKVNYLVIQEKEPNFADKYKIFSKREDAVKFAQERVNRLGKPFWGGIPNDAMHLFGMMSIYKSGEIDVCCIAVEVV